MPQEPRISASPTSAASPASPLVSIVLPTHNRPEVLKFAIKSVLDQTVRDFELIVIGDGCVDNTAELVQEFEQRDPRVRWLDLPKAPYYGYANINVGLRQATGRFLAYMAHDDLWLHDHLESLLGYFEGGIEVAYSRPLWISPEGYIYPLSFNMHDQVVRGEFTSMRRNSLPAACFVIRHDCIEKYGAWDETLSENADWDVWARIIRLGGGNNFAYHPEPTCLHFRAIWKTEANPGPAELFTWKDRHEAGLTGSGFSVPVAGFATEQEAFASRLQANPTAFARDLRTECRRLLDRAVMDRDLHPVQLIHQMRELEDRIERLSSQMGVFEYSTLGPGIGVVYGQGVFPDEQGSRWLSNEARMIFLTGGRAAKVTLTLRCAEAANYDRFPLELEVLVSGAPAAGKVFKSSGKKHEVSFELAGDATEVVLGSGGAFVPGDCGVNDDRRRLSLMMTSVKAKTTSKNDAALQSRF